MHTNMSNIIRHAYEMATANDGHKQLVLPLSGELRTKEQTVVNIYEDAEELEVSYTVDENVKFHCCLGKWLGKLSKS